MTDETRAPEGAAVPRVREDHDHKGDDAAPTDDGGDVALLGLRERMAGEM